MYNIVSDLTRLSLSLLFVAVAADVVMYTAQWFCFLHFLLIIFSIRCGKATPVQYCKTGDYNRTDTRIALSSYYNETTHCNDLNVQFSVQFSANTGGWAALGAGDAMQNSLMYIVYPADDKQCL